LTVPSLTAHNHLSKCAHHTLRTPPDHIAELFDLHDAPRLYARYNVASSQPISVVGAKPDGRRRLSLFRWGFVPIWSDGNLKVRPVNAKAETVATTPMFRDAFRKRRCQVPAAGSFEWRTVGKRKMPVHSQLKGGAPFAFAGVWDCWKGGEKPLYTVAILNTKPNQLTRTVHDRMPVILPPSEFALWLDPAVGDPVALRPLLAPYSADEMEAHPANPAMNQPAIEGPECLPLVIGIWLRVRGLTVRCPPCRSFQGSAPVRGRRVAGANALPDLLAVDGDASVDLEPETNLPALDRQNGDFEEAVESVGAADHDRLPTLP
jgi:putative SOS response-associated peptidase YedK